MQVIFLNKNIVNLLCDRTSSINKEDTFFDKITCLSAIHFYHFLFLSDPMNVIGLYPGLIPEDLRQMVAEQHPIKLPILSGVDLEEGLKNLVCYLTYMRWVGKE